MEKKFVSFLILSAAILVSFQLLNAWLNPIDPEAVVNRPVEEGDEGVALEQADAEAEDVAVDDNSDAEITAPEQLEDDRVEEQAGPVPREVVTLGSLDPEDPFKMLVWATNRGASIEAIALNDPHYTDLDDKSGYLGYFAFSPDDLEARIHAVGQGTPAAKATPQESGNPVGLQVNDVITKIDGVTINQPEDVRLELANTKPGQQIEITVKREDRELVYQTTLVKRPLEVIRPEPLVATEDNPQHPLSYRLTLSPLNARNRGQKDKPGIAALLEENWEMHPLEGDDPGVEFRYHVDAKRFPELKLESDLLVIKRFRLAKRNPDEEPIKDDGRLYHLDFDFEIKNLGDKAAKVSYQLDGPTGLPLEGWWYTYKTHPTSFGGAGVRDIIVKAYGEGTTMFTNPKIVKDFEKSIEASESGDSKQTQPYKSLFGTNKEGQPGLTGTGLQYAGVDAQYFASALLADAPDEDDTSQEAQAARESYFYESVLAVPVANKVDAVKPSKTNISFRLVSDAKEIPAGESYGQKYVIFAGPKDREVLSEYGLENFITYGWFPLIARPLMAVLHFFYGITGNYGIAIILLTVLVRGCMFPLGRQQVLNAQKMQELAPEMKAIAEKYKDDMEKRAAAQRELFRKHNYNPLAGCLPVFFQLPIFIGLYRALSVDIELRQAALIPGISWASNLAGPDQLWYWKPFLPAFLASETGWLGPYLNILPLISVALMIVHQKMFTPPPTDEQQEMQQRIMKYMMVFFGFMFFRVPAGLCLYFITSSAWGLAERKLLPKPKVSKTEPKAVPAEAKPSLIEKLSKGKTQGTNGAKNIAERRRHRQKKR